MKNLKIVTPFLMALFISTNAFSMNVSDGYKVGDKVSDFTIQNYNGADYTLSKSGANFTVIIFMSTTCPFVQPYTDRLNGLVKEFGSNGVAIWGINSNKTESTKEVMDHAAKKGYQFPVLKDESSSVADQFGAERTPEVFVIRNSDMTLMYHGRIDDDKSAENVTSSDLKNALISLNEGNEIAVKNTKAFGCTIKR
ncbi:MAG: redoxin domain-containing protein [Bacteroidetes bacterium]|nr:redoxin domain-containing protein [Bacteroidota bacterium]